MRRPRRSENRRPQMSRCVSTGQLAVQPNPVVCIGMAADTVEAAARAASPDDLFFRLESGGVNTECERRCGLVADDVVGHLQERGSAHEEVVLEAEECSVPRGRLLNRRAMCRAEHPVVGTDLEDDAAADCALHPGDHLRVDQRHTDR